MMWIVNGGGFETVSVPEPLSFFEDALLKELAKAADEDLQSLLQEAADKSDAVLSHLQTLGMPEDSDDAYEWESLPGSIRFRWPRDGESLLDQIDRVDLRWRLDAAMAMEEGIVELLEMRERAEGA